MLVLTATASTQGERDNDYHWAIEGELVWLDPPCARDRRNPDGGCGCGRGFPGLNSHRATTTAMARDLPLTRDDVVAARIGYLASAGYGRFTPDDIRADVDTVLGAVRRLTSGDIVERRLDELRLRVHR